MLFDTQSCAVFCLTYRLSGFASKQLTQGNPDFADLSDKNRPSKIAEFFHNIYDDEWTSALEALTHTKRGSTSQSEEDVIIFLMEIIQVKCSTSMNLLHVFNMELIFIKACQQGGFFYCLTYPCLTVIFNTQKKIPCIMTMVY